MVNHYHLVLQSLKGDLSTFMKRLLGSYTRIFNDRWVTVGHVLQGRFGSRRCKTESEIRAAIRYVHLNPVEARLVPTPDLWRWSGHPGLLAGSDPVVDMPKALELFGGVSAYIAFLEEPTTKQTRRSLDEIAASVAGPDLGILPGRTLTPETRFARRDFVVVGLSEGYRRIDLARYLGLSSASITKLIRGWNE